MEKIILGKEVYLTDPCYDIGTWCQALIKNVKEGNWFVEYDYDEFADDLCVCLSLAHEGYCASFRTYKEKEIGDLGVDSGNLGVFDKEYYERYNGKNKTLQENWYAINVMGQDFNKRYAITTDNQGVFCNTSYGDGVYNATLYFNEENEVIGIEILM